MRPRKRIAIVGAGQAGLQLGFGLLEKGCAVTLVADRTPDEVFNSRLGVTAGLFKTAIGYERELGVNFWEGRAPLIDGVHIDFCINPRNLMLTVEGSFGGPCMAIDHRLKMSKWMRELERRGGQLVKQAVTEADLEDLAESHDGVFVAAGRSGLASLFPRDEARSLYKEPRRNLILLTLAGLRRWDRIGFRHPAKFSITAGVGEIFWIPFLGRNGEDCFSVVFEGWPGSPMDAFGPVQTADEALATARRVVQELAPWEAGTIANARMIDDLAWAKGAITPMVRKPFARLPSGRFVFALGDTALTYDPVGAQGANCASKMAHGLSEEIAARGDEPLDAAWMERWFDGFWEEHARHMVRFDSIMLEPLQAPAREIVLAASRSRAVGDRFISSFNHPADYFPWLDDLEEARRFIAKETGRPWLWTGLPARVGVGVSQVLFRLGLAPVPSAPPVYQGA